MVRKVTKKSKGRRPSAKSKTLNAVEVVGIGTSAGGLGSLETFLKNVPAECGVAFAIVQHLDPERKALLPSLLQRVTPMPVCQVDELTPVEANCVYVIPPNNTLTLRDGLFHLTKPKEAHGHRLPIDLFFQSLANTLRERAIGVVLSGMGSDGTLGLLAIRERGGKSYVQDPKSAKFKGMPNSAIDAGAADTVTTLEELPGCILRAIRGLKAPAAEVPSESADQNAYQRVNSLLRAQTGHDFSLYKKSTLLRRMQRRMALHQVDSLARYADYLRDNPQEAALLFNECLIGVTHFFRDEPSWEQLANNLLEWLSKSPPESHQLRAWVAGCSSGEEAYSLAIVFKEVASQLPPSSNFQLQIFATDIDSNAVNKARLGFFPTESMKPVSEKRRKEFFVEEKDGFRADSSIREMIVFAPQTLITDPPFTKLDILCCRNLLIYFSVQLQEHLIQLFHYCLKDPGFLFLGSSETVGPFTNLFVPVDDTLRMYKRRATAQNPEPPVFPQPLLAPHVSESTASRLPRPSGNLPATLQSLTSQLILRDHCPTAILASPQGAVLYTSGRPGRYLEPAIGAANWNIFVMARDGLRHELYAAFTKAQRHKRVVKIDNLGVDLENRAARVNVTVRPLTDPETLRGLILVVIADVTELSVKLKRAGTGGTSKARVSELQHELMLARDSMTNMQLTAQISQEEHRSANEELQSANEELQSANEEMVTSKEEMQSLNEELHTVNQELEQRVADLGTANSDMNNLLDNTSIVSLFLDINMCIRRFTPGATNLIKLIPSDVGRPFTDLATEFDYPGIADDARRTMRTLVPHERRILSRGGRRFLVRIDCYRTLQNKVDGVVITFTDVSASESLASELADRKAFFGKMAEGLDILSWSYRADGSCDKLGSRWLSYTGLPESEQTAHGWLRQVHDDDRSRIVKQAALSSGQRPVTFQLRVRGANGTYLSFRACSIPEFSTAEVLLRWSCWAIRIDDASEAQVGRP